MTEQEWEQLFSRDNKMIIEKLHDIFGCLGEHGIMFIEHKEEFQQIKSAIQEQITVLQDILVELRNP